MGTVLLTHIAVQLKPGRQSSACKQTKISHNDGVTILIDLEKITVPTLVICGDKDPYLNYDAVNASPERLPEGSELKIIPGGSHILLYEKNCYKEFQDDVVRFLLGK